jgi:two-component system, LytTR family, response regulator
MKANCIIVEDEPLALERARGYVLKIPALHLSATFDNALEAMGFLRSNPVDLLFLDIHLGEVSGIQLLENTSLGCQVILTTAYHEYALKGFDLKVADYLLKPYTFERFLQAVDRALQLSAKAAPTQAPAFIFVKTENRLEKVSLDEVLYIEGMGDYRCIHTLHKRILTLQTFLHFEQEIPQTILCRVHKSYMVAPGKIDSIEKDRIYIQGKIIPVSETYKRGFYALL